MLLSKMERVPQVGVNANSEGSLPWLRAQLDHNELVVLVWYR